MREFICLKLIEYHVDPIITSNALDLAGYQSEVCLTRQSRIHIILRRSFDKNKSIKSLNLHI